MLTVQMLKDMKHGEVIASGEFVDSHIGINVARTGEMCRWVAVRGGIHDWAIYCDKTSHDLAYIARHGTKIHTKDYIKRLVDCDEEAFKMYRH